MQENWMKEAVTNHPFLLTTERPKLVEMCRRDTNDSTLSFPKGDTQNFIFSSFARSRPLLSQLMPY